jgi:tetratricopeptide (TPR) repeat protein
LKYGEFLRGHDKLLFFNNMQLPKVFLFCAWCGVALAAPHIPGSDGDVLERLPGRRDDPVQAELRSLRAASNAAPEDSAAAATLARRYFDLANAEGDPRYVGYAEAALRRWPSNDAPVEVAYVRGLLRQYRHDFDTALGEFERVLSREPDHFGARSWRAGLYMVRADYASAARECAALPVEKDDLYAVACRAYIDATTGKTAAAYRQLAGALAADRDVEPGERLWVLTRLGEMAWRLGDAAAADRHFRDALALGRDDNFLLAAYADFLLEQGRAKEAARLLRDWTRSDTLLLRLAMAEKQLGSPDAQLHIQALGERFAAASLRGERLHMGEEARYLLDLKGDPAAALAVGLENWKEQREPRDALVVLEAAAAARDAKAAAPVLKWLEQSGFESERMRRAAASLR